MVRWKGTASIDHGERVVPWRRHPDRIWFPPIWGLRSNRVGAPVVAPPGTRATADVLPPSGGPRRWIGAAGDGDACPVCPIDAEVAHPIGGGPPDGATIVRGSECCDHGAHHCLQCGGIAASGALGARPRMCQPQGCGSGNSDHCLVRGLPVSSIAVVRPETNQLRDPSEITWDPPYFAIGATGRSPVV